MLLLPLLPPSSLPAPSLPSLPSAILLLRGPDPSASPIPPLEVCLVWLVMGGYMRYAGTPVAVPLDVVAAAAAAAAAADKGYEVLAVENCDMERDGRCKFCGAIPVDPPPPPPPPDTIEAYVEPRKAEGGGLPLFPVGTSDIEPGTEPGMGPGP